MATVDLQCTKDAIVASTNLGSGQDSHNVAGAEVGRTLYFLLDFEALPNITNLISAKLLLTRSQSGVHDAPSNGAAARCQRITGDWQEGNKGGPEPTPPGEFYYTSNAVTWANKPAVTTTGEVTGGSQPSTADTQWSVTVTAIVQAWLDGSAKKGIQVRSSNDVLDICAYSRHTSSAGKRPILRLEYGTNHAPSAPTVVLQGT